MNCALREQNNITCLGCRLDNKFFVLATLNDDHDQEGHGQEGHGHDEVKKDKKNKNQHETKNNNLYIIKIMIMNM